MASVEAVVAEKRTRMLFVSGFMLCVLLCRYQLVPPERYSFINHRIVDPKNQGPGTDNLKSVSALGSGQCLANGGFGGVGQPYIFGPKKMY